MDVNLLLGTEQVLMLHSISTNNMNIQTLASQYWYIYNLHCSDVMKRKPRLHDGIVTVGRKMDSQGFS